MVYQTHEPRLFQEAKHSATRGTCWNLAPRGPIETSVSSTDPRSNVSLNNSSNDSQSSVSPDDSQSSVFCSDEAKNVEMDMEKLARGVRLILEAVGEDAERAGLIDTPSRVARMYRELLYGITIDPASEVTCNFDEGNCDPVVVKDISFATICEHHLVPFFGKAHVAYIPKDGRITGLSKIARVVELAARRLQVQERMTAQIADAMMKALSPHGAMVILEAEHLCMSIRGIKKPGSQTTTMASRGVLNEDRYLRKELLQLIKT